MKFETQVTNIFEMIRQLSLTSFSFRMFNAQHNIQSVTFVNYIIKHTDVDTRSTLHYETFKK